ncbi:hypothetical protein ACLOJK_014356 [Asimina triloba]
MGRAWCSTESASRIDAPFRRKEAQPHMQLQKSLGSISISRPQGGRSGQSRRFLLFTCLTLTLFRLPFIPSGKKGAGMVHFSSAFGFRGPRASGRRKGSSI